MFIENVASLGGFSGSGGLFGQTDAEPDYGAEATWTSDSSHIDAGSNYGAYQAPQYFIKQFTTVSGVDGALNLSGYGDNKGAGDVTVFKVTGRGTGGSAESAEVILRSYYGRIF
jgi:hypothetical protein